MNRKENQKTQESVETELNEMFNQIPFWERVKLQMVAFQYRKETPMFKMLFDKKFRFERYNEILSNKKKFKNKSQFKSYIFTNFNQFDIS